MKGKLSLLLFLLLLLSMACELPLWSSTPAPDLDATLMALYAQQTLIALTVFPTSTPTLTPFIPPPAESPAPEASPTPTLSHLLRPPDGLRPRTALYDTISGDSARQGQPNQPPGGDEYLYNLYERPFNAVTMDIFFPELDIRKAEMGHDATWMFTTIYLYGLDPTTSSLTANYRLELDLDLDGRGDWLFEARAPLQETWAVEGVRIWEDSRNNDIGEARPCFADPPQDGDSYDLLVFDQGFLSEDPDLAWSRFRPGNPPSVQIAFKHALIGNDERFMWGVWADRGVDQPQWYDYHDHFTLEEAGSPYRVNRYYPIKAIAEVDNTCRWTYGFEPTGKEPCLCAGGRPTPVPPTATVPATPPSQPGGLAGWVFKKLTTSPGCTRQEGDGGFGGAEVRVLAGACPGGRLVATALTAEFGRYSVMGLPPGEYCVYAPQVGVALQPPFVTVRVRAGRVTDNVNFGYCP